MKLLVPFLVGAGLVVAFPVGAKPREQAVAKPSEVDNICGVFGEGFQRVPGSDVCVKVSASITETVGVSGRSRRGTPGH